MKVSVCDRKLCGGLFLLNSYIIHLDNTIEGELTELLIKTKAKKKANTLCYMTDSRTNKFFAFILSSAVQMED